MVLRIILFQSNFTGSLVCPKQHIEHVLVALVRRKSPKQTNREAWGGHLPLMREFIWLFDYCFYASIEVFTEDIFIYTVKLTS